MAKTEKKKAKDVKHGDVLPGHGPVAEVKSKGGTVTYLFTDIEGGSVVSGYVTTEEAEVEVETSG